MPAAAYALLGFFAVVSVAAGAVAWWTVEPRHWWLLPAPVLAAFGLLYLAGHRFGWSWGPAVRLFGFEVSLLFDLALALASALVVALAQRGLLALTRNG